MRHCRYVDAALPQTRRRRRRAREATAGPCICMRREQNCTYGCSIQPVDLLGASNCSARCDARRSSPPLPFGRPCCSAHASRPSCHTSRTLRPRSHYTVPETSPPQARSSRPSTRLRATRRARCTCGAAQSTRRIRLHATGMACTARSQNERNNTSVFLGKYVYEHKTVHGTRKSLALK